MLSVTQGPRHLIAIHEDPPRFELYDREVDPEEQSDLYPAAEGEAAGLLELLEAYQREARAPWGEAPLAVRRLLITTSICLSVVLVQFIQDLV